jgi:hypothetical protein
MVKVDVEFKFGSLVGHGEFETRRILVALPCYLLNTSYAGMSLLTRAKPHTDFVDVCLDRAGIFPYGQEKQKKEDTIISSTRSPTMANLPD